MVTSASAWAACQGSRRSVPGAGSSRISPTGLAAGSGGQASPLAGKKVQANATPTPLRHTSAQRAAGTTLRTGSGAAGWGGRARR